MTIPGTGGFVLPADSACYSVPPLYSAEHQPSQLRKSIPRQPT
jgi:hypothetical protein